MLREFRWRHCRRESGDWLATVRVATQRSNVHPVTVVGIDLSAEPKDTALAVVNVSAGPRVVELRPSHLSDIAILAHLKHLTGPWRLAVDCPLGWPKDFLDFLIQHRHGHVVVPYDEDGLLWRRRLSRRVTDLHLEKAIGVRPLSVAADRIGAVAMRGAGLQSHLHAARMPVPRDGSGALLETYPAAALRVWGLPHQQYKRLPGRAVLTDIVDGLVSALPDLLSPADARICRASDDATDAVVCALVAATAVAGDTEPVPSPHAVAARTEGWIHYPRAGHRLADLRPG